MRSATGRAAATIAAAALLVFGVPALGDFWTFVATLAVVYALLGVSLVVLTGWTGQLNLHVAALGLGWGAYAAFALSAVGAPPLLALLAAPVLTIPFSLAVGGVAVRFRGLELAVATLAIGLTFEQLVFRNLGSWLAGASSGSTPFASSFVSVARPHAFATDHAFYLLALGLAAIVVACGTNVSRSGTHRALLALREREVAAEVAGIPVLRYRTGAFVASIAIAGLAGALFAGLKQGIAPESFDLNLSFLLLAAVVIGGIRTLRGGILGGILAAALPEVVRFGPLRLVSGERLTFLFGAGMVLTLGLRPKGLLARRSRRAAIPELDAPAAAAPRRRRRTTSSASRPSALRADGLSVRFGGVQALDDVSVTAPEGEICALIGPNGAGKTTLFNCLSGIVTPDRGRVFLRRDDISAMPPHRRAELGLGRTFQSVELFAEQTARENLMVAGRRSARPFADALRLPAAQASERALRRRADEMLGLLAIDHLAEAVPDDLGAADLRRLELGCVLMREPSVLLLDEPTAGLSPTESIALARLIASLRDERGLTVMLVEHDMTVVGEIADWVHVLDFGRIVAAGSPGSVRRDRHVIDIYLGREVRDAASA